MTQEDRVSLENDPRPRRSVETALQKIIKKMKTYIWRWSFEEETACNDWGVSYNPFQQSSMTILTCLKPQGAYQKYSDDIANSTQLVFVASFKRL